MRVRLPHTAGRIPAWSRGPPLAGELLPQRSEIPHGLRACQVPRLSIPLGAVAMDQTPIWSLINPADGFAVCSPWRYIPTRLRCSSKSPDVKPMAPRPLSPASRYVSGWPQATHIGGCGFCTGFGSTVSPSTLWNLPLKITSSSAMRRGISSTPSIHRSRVSAGSTSNASSCRRRVERPVPNSTRPLLTRSMVATLSATRTG